MPIDLRAIMYILRDVSAAVCKGKEKHGREGNYGVLQNLEYKWNTWTFERDSYSRAERCGSVSKMLNA